MTAQFNNACRFNATSAGTGDFVVTSAVSGHLTPDQAGAIDGKVYFYFARGGLQWEYGSGLYTASSHTLARTVITATSNSNTSLVSFGSAPTVDVFPSPSVLLEPVQSGGGLVNLTGSGSGNIISTNADAITLYDSFGHGVNVTNISCSSDMSGNGANGLDTGSLANNADYYSYVIFNPTTNTVAGLGSLQPASPTLPAGYTYKRRVGWFFRVSGSIRAFAQRGSNFTWNTAVPIASGTNAGANVSLTGAVSSMATIARFQVVSNNNNVTIGDNIGNTVFSINSITSGQCFWFVEFVIQNVGYQVFYASNSGGGQVAVQSWMDNL